MSSAASVDPLGHSVVQDNHQKDGGRMIGHDTFKVAVGCLNFTADCFSGGEVR